MINEILTLPSEGNILSGGKDINYIRNEVSPTVLKVCEVPDNRGILISFDILSKPWSKTSTLN